MAKSRDKRQGEKSTAKKQNSFVCVYLPMQGSPSANPGSMHGTSYERPKPSATLQGAGANFFRLIFGDVRKA